MELIELFRIIILKIDLKGVNLRLYADYESLRQELGVNINSSLSGPRVGKWIGGRKKQKNILIL